MPEDVTRRDMPMLRTLADVSRLLEALPAADADAVAAAGARERRLTKPAGALGRLEDLAAWLAAWQRRHPPVLERPRALIFAGNHGVTRQGVSAYPPVVTSQMVANFGAGGAAINQLCRAFSIELSVYPIALDRPTGDFTEEAALAEDECVAAIRLGVEAAFAGGDLLCLGEMGIGNTTAAAALAHALFGGQAVAWTGPGTGVSDGALQRKAAVVAAGVRRHAGAAGQPLELLRCLGGRELAAIAGAVIGARLTRQPVLLDGYVCTAAAAVLAAARPGVLDHCRVAHVSGEPGHRLLLARLGMAPLLDLGMRLGEGSGAALAVALVRAALACHVGMSTFDDAGIAGSTGGQAGG